MTLFLDGMEAIHKDHSDHYHDTCHRSQYLNAVGDSIVR
jgi:hypothetical protein